jgi:hypothetical protein
LKGNDFNVQPHFLDRYSGSVDVDVLDSDLSRSALRKIERRSVTDVKLVTIPGIMAPVLKHDSKAAREKQTETV